MTTITDKEITEAKAQKKFFQERLQSLQAEAKKLEEQTEGQQDKVLNAIVDGRDPAKIRAEFASETQKLRDIRGAIVLCKQKLAEATTIANTEKMIIYKKHKADFARHLVSFCDVDFKNLLASFSRLESEYMALIDESGQCGASYGSSEFPYIEKNVFDTFYLPLNKNALPTDIQLLENRLSDFFKTTRQAQKKGL